VSPIKKLHIILLSAAAVVLAGALLAAFLIFGGNSSERALSARELLELGEKYLLELNYTEARYYFEKLIEIEPKNPRGYTGLAEAFIGLGQPERAASTLQKGLRELPGNTELTAKLEEAETLVAEAASPSPPPSPSPSDTPPPSAAPVDTAAITLPDTAFEAAVRELIGKPSGELTAADAAGVTELDVSNKGIKSLTGLEYFTHLTALRCYGNDLTALDLTPCPTSKSSAAATTASPPSTFPVTPPSPRYGATTTSSLRSMSPASRR
jgi:tetratricopeptide (TPR) repeat protein